mmetsp:Transcript_7107/g.17709  ORF Transcript_7107/g.17709 Transcript_7107/m.17709 type:complete len:104 (-) Transcript_7107:207-518(-)
MSSRLRSRGSPPPKRWATDKPSARGRGAAQPGTGEPRLEDENQEEAVERSGEGSARAGGGKLGRCRQLGDGKEAAPPQHAGARPVPDEHRTNKTNNDRSDPAT